MTKVVRVNPFSVDYTNLEAVKELAKKLGGNSTVIKEPTRNNYNIVHLENVHRYPNAQVIVTYK